jgi:ATP-dependent RNA helicase RhlE
MSFDRFKFHPDLMRGITDMHYEVPTLIQEKVIAPILEGKDVIGNAQTGTGKTAAFLLPLIQRVIGKPKGKTRALILVPTRELACQIDDSAVGLAYHTSVSTAAVYGGVPMELQERALTSGSTLVVATPGRLLDHYKYGNWRFDELEILVMDEADRMLDMGFIPDIQSIISKIPKNRQTLLFSATMPDMVMRLARTLLKDPLRVKAGEVTPPSRITQIFYPVSDHDKTRLLVYLLKQAHLVSVLIFMQTKIGVNRLGRALQREGFKAGILHGGREQVHRDEVLNQFKHGLIPVLVATDVASRGIDIDGISHVINYDLPMDLESYVHRIGRTARVKAIGDALSFVTPEDEERSREFEKAVGIRIERKLVEGFHYRKPDKSSKPHHRPKKPFTPFKPRRHRH